MKNTELANTVVKQLIKSGKTVAVAESLTGGGLGAAITEVAGSSEVFLGGITTYSDTSKTKLLDVPKRLITKHTAVSEEVAKEMASNARNLFKTDYAISTTGDTAAANLTAGLYFLTTAITANSTTTTAPAGSIGTTSNATGLGKLFVSDGSKWQFAVVA